MPVSISFLSSRVRARVLPRTPSSETSATHSLDTSASFPARLLSTSRLDSFCKRIVKIFGRDKSTISANPRWNDDWNTEDVTCQKVHPRWNVVWNEGLDEGMAFDAASPSPLLVKYIAEGLIPKGRALVPGCGRGYDVTALCAADRTVLGLDIAAEAVKAARTRLERLPAEEVSCKENAVFDTTSFFDLPEMDDISDNNNNDDAHQQSKLFDFVYDYTFLCALDPSIREEWAAKMGQVVRPEGELLTLIFPIGDKVGGPPFKVSLELVRGLLEPVGFECLELRMLPPELCHRGRDGGPRTFGGSGVGRWRKM